ncbi:hypothetical protein E2C01_007041 [Portunus trituberculatus]|uniref:Uncharacterized protein n=1 Tax=Portunus trituberculatus TaxID=210409 RepID=A0A5B7CWS2_PORTR|nr:hypothetical protein [Portunus trituberculatus]
MAYGEGAVGCISLGGRGGRLTRKRHSVRPSTVHMHTRKAPQGTNPLLYQFYRHSSELIGDFTQE